MNNIRQEQMKEYIEQRNLVTIKELQALFPSVSLMTIHRDLDALEAGGFVVKFRGLSGKHSEDSQDIKEAHPVYTIIGMVRCEDATDL